MSNENRAPLNHVVEDLIVFNPMSVNFEFETIVKHDALNGLCGSYANTLVDLTFKDGTVKPVIVEIAVGHGNSRGHFVRAACRHESGLEEATHVAEATFNLTMTDEGVSLQVTDVNFDVNEEPTHFVLSDKGQIAELSQASIDDSPILQRLIQYSRHGDAAFTVATFGEHECKVNLSHDGTYLRVTKPNEYEEEKYSRSTSTRIRVMTDLLLSVFNNIFGLAFSIGVKNGEMVLELTPGTLDRMSKFSFVKSMLVPLEKDELVHVHRAVIDFSDMEERCTVPLPLSKINSVFGYLQFVHPNVNTKTLQNTGVVLVPAMSMPAEIDPSLELIILKERDKNHVFPVKINLKGK